MTTEDKLLLVLRAQAWQRAKGELRGVAETFFGEGDREALLAAAIEAFIAQIEGEGLAQ